MFESLKVCIFESLQLEGLYLLSPSGHLSPDVSGTLESWQVWGVGGVEAAGFSSGWEQRT